MTGRFRTLLILAVAVAGAAVAAVLLLQHHGEGPGGVSALCVAEGASGCDIVNRSAYSEFRGIPLAAAGILFYVSLALLMLLAFLGGSEARDAAGWIALLLFALALTLDLALLGVQAFALRAFCRLCVLTYALNALAAVVLMPARRAATALFKAMLQVDGRLLLAGWLLGTGASVAAVGATELTLRHRETERQATLLGRPAPPAATTGASSSPAATAPSPDATGGGAASPGPGAAAGAARLPEQLRQAQDQAKRLQDILDDPRKLDQYFADKAAKEYAQAQVQQLDVKEAPVTGSADAPVRAVTYSDFLCPYCRSLAAALGQYLPQAGKRLVVYFKHYPLDQACNPNIKNTVHAGACFLALGAICAQEQGRFWPYHDKVFGTNLTNPQAADAVKLASEVGISPSAFESCLASSGTKERLAREIAEGAKAGVAGTPTVFVNGKRLPRINDFAIVVDKEAAKAGFPPLQSPPPQK